MGEDGVIGSKLGPKLNDFLGEEEEDMASKTKNRTIRFKNGNGKTEEKQKTAEDLLTIPAAKIKNDQITQLIDAATEWDMEQKALAKNAKAAKALLLSHAKSKKWKTRAGETAVCTIKQSSSTEVDVTGLAQLLKRLGKKNLFVDLVKVKITEAKQYLGEHSLKECSEVVTEEYGSVTLKSTK